LYVLYEICNNHNKAFFLLILHHVKKQAKSNYEKARTKSLHNILFSSLGTPLHHTPSQTPPTPTYTKEMEAVAEELFNNCLWPSWKVRVFPK